jgi:hypothetical protein
MQFLANFGVPEDRMDSKLGPAQCGSIFVAGLIRGDTPLRLLRTIIIG